MKGQHTRMDAGEKVRPFQHSGRIQRSSSYAGANGELDRPLGSQAPFWCAGVHFGQRLTLMRRGGHELRRVTDNLWAADRNAQTRAYRTGAGSAEGIMCLSMRQVQMQR